MSNIWKPLTSSGPIPPNIPTNFIGDNGTVAHPAANNITIYANNAANQAGSSVKFFNSGAISLLEFTDANGNTIIGNNAGNLTITGQSNVGLGTAVLFALTSGLRNTALGAGSLQAIMGDADNTGVGYQALKVCLGANQNTAVGSNCLVACTSGDQNTGVGQAALGGLVTGSNCTAIGFASLTDCTGGSNTALGWSTAPSLLGGTFNLFLGTSAGENYTTTESSNILISNAGVAAESHVIRIGTQGAGDGQQNTCFIAGIENNTLAGSPVVVTALGQLGVGDSSSEAATLITKFSSNGSWTPNTRTKYAEFFLWGSGGGGGSGRCGVSAAAGGGGGGGNGEFLYTIAQATSFAAGPYTITVGSGVGLGGVSVNAVTTNGNPGTIGNPSSIGSLCSVRGGNFGAGGTTTTAGGATARSAFSLFAGIAPANAGNGTATSGNTPGSSVMVACTCGGGGGGYTVATPSIGGSGAGIEDPALNILEAGGAAVSGGQGNTGNPPVNQLITIGGTGGAGGGFDGTATAHAGGAGATPGGGGGGGAGNLSSVASGAGGDGGNGLVIIIEHF